MRRATTFIRQLGLKGTPYDNIVYGFLYNWPMTQTQTNGSSLIPSAMATEGWRIPTDTDWSDLIDYVDTEYNVSPDDFGVSLHLKSCRTDNSPLGGACDTTVDPYWGENSTYYGRNTVGMSLYAGGVRSMAGTSVNLRLYGFYWTGTAIDATNARARGFASNSATINSAGQNKMSGYSIRPVRDTTSAEDLLSDGILSGTYYTGNDGKVYRCTKIGDQVWTIDNLAETKYSNGNLIPIVENANTWGDLIESGIGRNLSGMCAWDNTYSYVPYTDKLMVSVFWGDAFSTGAYVQVNGTTVHTFNNVMEGVGILIDSGDEVEVFLQSGGSLLSYEINGTVTNIVANSYDMGSITSHTDIIYYNTPT